MDRRSSSQHSQRLREIAAKYGVPREFDLTPLARPKQPPTFSILDDERKADSILGQLKIEESQSPTQAKGLKRAFTKAPKPSTYTYRELYAALLRVIDDDDLPGVAEVLLRRFKAVDGDINIAQREHIGIVSRIRNSTIQAEPGWLVQRATGLHRHEILQLLVPHANQESLDESLQISLGARDLDVTETLLRYGADSTPQESVFTQGTENGDFELLELLLKAPKKISDQAITRNLLTATVKGHFQLVLLFVSAGANANEGSALRCAVDTGRTDITTALLLCKNPPSPMSLDQALESLLTAPQGVVNNSYEMIEMLLCAGPEGNAVNEGLIKATFLANFDLMRLFLLHKADINYDRAAAVGYAIQKIRNDVVGLLLQDRQLRPELAAELVSKIPENTPSADKVAILSKLLVNGASGEQCSRLLIIAAEQNDLDTARLLVSKDLNGSQISSVDYSAGRSLQVAIAQSNLEMAKLLALEGSPSKFSLTKAFSSIPPKLSKDSHYMMVHALLQAGAEGPEVDAALYAAVTAQHKSTRLIELLVQHTATVSNDILSSAVKQGAVDIIKILLTGNMSAETCASGIDLAMKQHTHKLRYTIIKQLLGPASNTDLETPWIAQAVIDILQNCPQDIPLLRLLCCEGKANINLYDGLAVVIAAKHPDPRVLDIVLQSEGGLPNPATVESGLKCVTDLPLTDPHRRHKFDSLLTRTKPQQAIDKSLIKEIRSALAVKQDLGVIEALLAAGADVNSFDGAPVFWAVRDPAMTGLILSKRPNARSLSVGFQQAIKLSDPERYELCEKLLRAGAVGEDIDKALCIAAKEGATALPLLQLLLPHANVNYKDGRVLRLVVQQGFLAGLDLLLTPRSIMPLPAIKLSAFVEAMKIKNAEQRLPLVERLLKAGIPIPIVSDALISAANSSDFKLTQLLLEYNASVEQNGGQAIRCASSLGRTDILELLVKGRHGSKPTLSTLTSGFAGALAFKNKDPEVYYQILQILLGAGAPEEAMNPALVEAVREGDRNLRLSQLLYTKGASVEWNGGESLEIAVQSASTETLRLLLQKPPSQNVLKRAYRSTSTVSREQRLEIVGLLLDAGKTIDKHVANTLTNATRENPPDRHLVKLLLGHGVFDEGESMAHAATTLDLETLALLVDTPKATPFISCAFQDAMRTDLLWHSHKGLSIVELMLKSGAAGDAVGEALYCAVEKAESGNDDLKRDFLDTLLRHGADINYGRGRALQRAASQVHVALIQKLLPGATADTKAMALPYLFTKCEDSARVLKAIQAFNDSLSGDDEGTFFSFQHPDSQLEPVLFLALNKFPYKPQILRALLDTGYNPNQWKQDEWDESEGMEPWPLLCWALDQPKKKISNINIELIIDEGANVNFTSKSGMTPLILAIKSQRSLIVEKLISKGAKVTTPDASGATPLVLASRVGNSEIMEHILDAGAECNDGSLHDAARDLRCEAMRVLIKYGHQVDYPSERHDGRSALAELCLNAVNVSPGTEQLEEAITCLIANGSNIRLRCMSEDTSEKTIFHYALDSADPLLILAVLLKLMWQVLNDDAFLYKDKTYTYSLTKYVEKDVFRGPPHQKAGILRLLRNKRGVDKFWANDIEQEQPDDYCGAPPSIEEEVRVQKLRRKRMLEERENVMFRLDMKRLTTVKEVEIMEIQHEADMRRDHEKAQANLYIMAQQADTKLQLDLYAEREKQSLLVEKQNREMEHMKEIGDVQVSTRRRIMEQGFEEERTKQMLQIEFVDASNEKEIEAMRAKFAIEGSARQDYESIDQRQHERELARIKMQKTLIDSSTALAGRLQNSGMNQRQIGYITGEVP